MWTVTRTPTLFMLLVAVMAASVHTIFVNNVNVGQRRGGGAGYGYNGYRTEYGRRNGFAPPFQQGPGHIAGGFGPGAGFGYGNGYRGPGFGGIRYGGAPRRPYGYARRYGYGGFGGDKEVIISASTFTILG
ncbi:keratin-associated protein 19-2-like [Ornithodoros turicata]|uniref:keratin-associated protein 19-2-like n=1 Tax=Ornithodoros turicata TaxID=34597 RepID=UPI00313A2167